MVTCCFNCVLSCMYNDFGGVVRLPCDARVLWTHDSDVDMLGGGEGGGSAGGGL